MNPNAKAEVKMNNYVNRKSFLAGLGAAGLGLATGLADGASSAMAQEDDAQETTLLEDILLRDPMQKRVELYNAFTAALAAELNVGSADEVDGAIRIAIMNVIDDQVGEDGLTAGQAEALKHLVATSEVPVGPMMFGHGPGGPGGFGHGMGMGPGPMGPGRMKLRDRLGDTDRRGDDDHDWSGAASDSESGTDAETESTPESEP
jgi:hypothetical protein